MELIYDSKAHEAIAAAGGAISPYPNPASDVELSAWTKTGASRAELLGNQHAANWLRGGRGAGFRSEICATAADDSKELKYIFGMGAAVRHSGELVARLRLAAGAGPAYAEKSLPDVLQETDFKVRLSSYGLQHPGIATCSTPATADAEAATYYTFDTAATGRPGKSLQDAIGVSGTTLLEILESARIT